MEGLTKCIVEDVEGHAMSELQGKNVAMVLAPNFEDVEAVDPKNYLEERGAKVTVIGVEMGSIEGKKGASLDADKTFDQVSVGDFDALIIPGGGAPENLRIHDGAVQFTREFAQSGKPVAAICHGAQLLISADVIQNKTITCVNKIRDDVKNAGANYVDEAIVVDDNFITSRVPKDIPEFNQAIAKSLAGVAVGD
jgi:protease I